MRNASSAIDFSKRLLKPDIYTETSVRHEEYDEIEQAEETEKKEEEEGITKETLTYEGTQSNRLISFYVLLKLEKLFFSKIYLSE